MITTFGQAWCQDLFRGILSRHDLQFTTGAMKEIQKTWFLDFFVWCIYIYICMYSGIIIGMWLSSHYNRNNNIDHTYIVYHICYSNYHCFGTYLILVSCITLSNQKMCTRIKAHLLVSQNPLRVALTNTLLYYKTDVGTPSNPRPP